MPRRSVLNLIFRAISLNFAEEEKKKQESKKRQKLLFSLVPFGGAGVTPIGLTFAMNSGEMGETLLSFDE